MLGRRSHVACRDASRRAVAPAPSGRLARVHARLEVPLAGRPSQCRRRHARDALDHRLFPARRGRTRLGGGDRAARDDDRPRTARRARRRRAQPPRVRDHDRQPGPRRGDGRVGASPDGRGPIGARLAGEALAGLLRVNGAEGPAIPAGGSALLFMDVTYPRNARRPARLTHAFTMSLSTPPARPRSSTSRGSPRACRRRSRSWWPRRCAGRAGSPATAAATRSTRTGERRCRSTAPCASPSASRSTGCSSAPSLRLFEGPVDRLASYGYFGDPIHSVAAGRVVSVQDGLPEQTPGALP